jgi:hypothetical protein
MDSSTVDPGAKGFLGIFGDNAADAAPPEPDAHDAAHDDATAADADSPEGSSTDDLSAEEVVAARLAAAAEASGIDVPDPDESEPAPDASEATHPLLAQPDAEPSLDALTPEQLRALAEEAIRLRGEVSTSSQAEAARKVDAAIATAVAQVQTEFEQNVLAVSANHYRAVYRDRLAKLANEVTEEQLPDAAAALADQVWAARKAWEDEQADAYEARAQQAAYAARLNAPEFRQYAAEHLVRQAGLPAAAVAEVLKTQDTRQFEARVAELVGIRDALLAERQRNQNQRRADANKALRDTTPRTAATGRPPGGKPPAYKGTAAEGVAIVRS